MACDASGAKVSQDDTGRRPSRAAGGGSFGVLSLGVLLALFTARRRAVTRIAEFRACLQQVGMIGVDRVGEMGNGGFERLTSSSTIARAQQGAAEPQRNEAGLIE